MIGFIGVGNMGGAIIASGIKSGTIREEELFLCDRSEEKRTLFPKARFTTDPMELSGECDMVFLAVKPNQIKEVTERYLCGKKDDAVFVTIAAGISIGYLKDIAGEDRRVIRVMPNTPVMVGKGVCALSRDDKTDDETFDRVKGIFAASGEVVILPEEKMNSVISLTSSSPAYLFLMADAMAEGAVRQGFSEDEAVRLAAAVFEGAARMILESGKTPMELADMVTSPGGTTRAARDVLEKYEFKEAIAQCMLACTRRAEELAK